MHNYEILATILICEVSRQKSLSISQKHFFVSMDRREPEAEKYKGPGGVKKWARMRRECM